jgi:hypothetical protein
MYWWFKLAMVIMLPIITLELIGLIVPLPRRKRKWGPRDY